MKTLEFGLFKPGESIPWDTAVQATPLAEIDRLRHMHMYMPMTHIHMNKKRFIWMRRCASASPHYLHIILAHEKWRLVPKRRRRF